MIARYDDYAALVLKIITKIPVCTKKQLALCLINYFGDIDEKRASSLMVAMQRNRKLLISQDGYILSMSFYQKLKRHLGTYHADIDGYDQTSRLCYLKKDIAEDLNRYMSSTEKELMGCLWLIADMMPSAAEFMVAGKPWNVAFTVYPREGQEGAIYMVTTCSRKNISQCVAALQALPHIKDPNMRACIRRIAIVDDIRSSSKIPHIGFSHIVMIDETKKKGYTVVKRRLGEEAWSEPEQ